MDCDQVDPVRSDPPGQACHLGGLDRSERSQRIGFARCGPHFHHDPLSPIDGEDVDLAPADGDVAGDDPEAMAPERSLCQLLTDGTD